MLQGRGIRGWFGPRFLFLLLGWTLSTITSDASDWKRHAVLAAIVVLSCWMDQREWKGMLYYMSLLKAMKQGERDADQES